MSRTEKKSRIRGVPPRLQIQAADCLTGSYPAVARFSIDGRSGSIDTWYNDRNTPIFGYYDNTDWPMGVPASYTGIDWASNETYELTSSISHSGTFRKGVGDKYAVFKKYPNQLAQQTLTPFKDLGDMAVDARSWTCNSKSVIYHVDEKNYAYYATGSEVVNVGEGFDSPLWSKQKIEIDIPVNKASTIKDLYFSSPAADNQFVSNSYRIAYYNVENGVWEGIGNGLHLQGYYDWVNNHYISDGIKNYTCGVTPNCMLWISGVFSDYTTLNGEYLQDFATSLSSIKSIGGVASTFGFPYAPKYHATSSQLIKMSKYISEPFLVEKAVLTISATYDPADFRNTSLFAKWGVVACCAMNTIFLLNQRKNMNLSYRGTANFNRLTFYAIGNDMPPPDYFTGMESTASSSIVHYSIPTRTILTAGGASIYVDTLRDVVFMHRILSCASQSFDLKSYDWGSGSHFAASISDNRNYDTLLTSSAITGASGMLWSKLLNLEMTAKTPARVEDSATYYGPGGWGYNYGGQSYYYYFITANNPDGTRNGLGVNYPFGRSSVSEYISSDKHNVTLVRTTTIGANTYTVTVNLPYTERNSAINPYLLLPTDELVLAWHLPVPQEYDNVVTASVVTFPVGNYKLTLYGCGISQQKEYINTTNQLLSSNAIYEDIG